jgi:glyoxylase-like metal-dependent hydrolase (beta-lactamase superfamily II)
MSRYDGRVNPGGPTAVRELAHLVIRKHAVSTMSNNVYLLTCRATGSQLMVDAADEPDTCLALVHEGGPRLDHIVTTHRHTDHVRALVAVAERTGARTSAGEEDSDALPLAPDRRLRHGDQISFGAVVLDVIQLRGHTPGSIALAYDDPAGDAHLFAGDSLFPGGVGATSHYPYQSFDTLIDDVERRVFEVYADDTWVYPGHGDDTTLGAERPHLAEWRARGW